ncbi:MAG: nucleoside monophosphate kinase [Rickettsiales bacterium]|jgi:adenylate kinase|nr:nucleoside monophosphate kinase [Rickettsiales bacterium]
MNKELIIFLGPPGSGKGTQADMLRKYGYFTFSTGYLLRREVKNNTEIGKTIQNIINNGKLVDDNLILKLCINEILSLDKDKIIIDGFPRTLKQAKLSQFFIKSSKSIILKKVFIFNLEENELIKRIRNRVTCSKCDTIYNLTVNKPKVDGICDICGEKLIRREDDLEINSIIKRNKIYLFNIPNITYFYAKNNLTFFIDALNKPDIINKNIIEVLNV